MWKTLVRLLVCLVLIELGRGKEFKGNLDPLKKLNSSQPQCDLQSYFSSVDGFQSLKKDLKEFCPSALSKSALSDEMKEKSLVLCPLLFSQLNRTCSVGKDQMSSITYETNLSKEKVCRSKSVPLANENLLPLINVKDENPLKIDAKNLCEQIIDDQTSKLVRLVYRLHLQLSKVNPKKDLPAVNVTSTTNSTSTNATAVVAATTTIIETKLVNVTKVLNETLTRNSSSTNSTVAPLALNVTLVGSSNLSNTTIEPIKLNSTSSIVTAKTLDLVQKETNKTQQEAKKDGKEGDDANEGEDEDRDGNAKETETKTDPKVQIDPPTKTDTTKKSEEKKTNDGGDEARDGEPKKGKEEEKEVPGPEKPKEDKPKADRITQTITNLSSSSSSSSASSSAAATKKSKSTSAVNSTVATSARSSSTSKTTEKEAKPSKQDPEETKEKEKDEDYNEGDNEVKDPAGDDDQTGNEDVEPESPKEPSSSNSKNKKEDEIKPPPKSQKERKPTNYDSDQGSSGSFVTYFLLFTLFVVVGYLVLHNKNKLIGYLVEGRRTKTSRTGSRPSHRHYEPIQNVNDVIDLDQNNFSTNK